MSSGRISLIAAVAPCRVGIRAGVTAKEAEAADDQRSEISRFQVEKELRMEQRHSEQNSKPTESPSTLSAQKNKRSPV